MLALIGVLTLVIINGLFRGVFLKGRRCYSWLTAFLAFGVSLLVSNKTDHHAVAGGFRWSDYSDAELA
jgi:hypothetical protein